MAFDGDSLLVELTQLLPSQQALTTMSLLVGFRFPMPTDPLLATLSLGREAGYRSRPFWWPPAVRVEETLLLPDAPNRTRHRGAPLLVFAWSTNTLPDDTRLAKLPLPPACIGPPVFSPRAVTTPTTSGAERGVAVPMPTRTLRRHCP